MTDQPPCRAKTDKEIVEGLRKIVMRLQNQWLCAHKELATLNKAVLRKNRQIKRLRELLEEAGGK